MTLTAKTLALAIAGAAAFTGSPAIAGAVIHETDATSINDAGVIAGSFFDNAGAHGFVDNNGVFTTVNVPGAKQTQISGINNAGVLSGYYVDASGGDHGFIDVGGTITTLDAPGFVGATTAYGLNNSNQVLVFAGIGTTSAAYVYSNGAYTPFGALGEADTLGQGINDAGVIAGFVNDPGFTNTHGFTDTAGTFDVFDEPNAATAPGAPYLNTEVEGINNLGDLVGYYNIGVTRYGFERSGGVFTTLDYNPTDINNLGVIVGTTEDGLDSHGFTLIDGVYSAFDDPDANITPPTGPVPEPSTWAMMILGFFGIGVLAQRKRRGLLAA
ncbi:MAG TPA: PEPxxWA-CTERM sorting domain-containing protein [Phenylobacterium sp.]|jgi:hypothetical protein|uniref:PEPxxWA-CTERM sorting domain-containing protein n=1 Tax=Phenylobacterium sp. TaxID=1871053 RepID=UPI002D692A23|nr:PEPxxWA-CTERM sorting domain-containing protein [Phenylobacterium sp.]HZZ68965.1 PEPxxWA-CTERM sorting domain-containing protein [Phenylobacterium sp.]